MSYQKLREIYEAGKTIEEIANEWEVSPSYIYLRLKKSGVTMRPPRIRPTLEKEVLRDRIIKLRAQNLNPRQIGEIVGLSREGVRHYLKSRI
jgi:DNA-directed RNA polymerase specialized sigma subunit